MSGDVAATLSVLALTSLGLGWYLGFRAVPAHLVFWSQCAFALLTAFRIMRCAFPWRGRADAVIRVGIIGFALAVYAGLALGSLGLLSRWPYLVVFAVLFAASRRLRVDADIARMPLPRALVVSGALLVPIVACVIAVGMTLSPLTLYDSLSYHLLFPARWLQEQRLSIVPTPFSDEAQAYAPANGELFFLWLMLPFHGDVLARVGQLPFYLLSGAALYALARRCGASAAHAVYAPLFFFFSRPIVEQAVGADVDLICWAMFLAALYTGIVAVDSNRRGDWIMWGVSVGLYFGSKYVSLVYSPIILLLPIVRGPRPRALWALPGVFALAAFWYLRNWVIAGSPIYPSTLAFAGLTLARGAYSRAAMQHSVFHTTNVRLLPVILSHAFGAPLFLFWAPFALLGAWGMLASKPRWPATFLLVVPVLMVPLFWFGVPDNVDSRFLLPAAMLALLPLAFAFRANRTWNACLHALFGAGLAWLVVGCRAELPVTLPWYMGGWLSLEGLVAPGALPWFVGVACLSGGLAYGVWREPRRALPALGALCAAASIVLAVGSQTWCLPSRCTVLNLSSTHVPPDMMFGWWWLSDHTKGATVAYSGNNVPYPLFGDHLANRVSYVNIDRHVEWRFHDYDRAHRRHHDDDPLPAAPLAISSGVLIPIDGQTIWHTDAVRPRYERMAGNREAWILNLKSLGVDCLFVSTLSAYEIDFVWHNSAGFPIEDTWAGEDPANFTRVYENATVRIYEVHLH